MNTHLKNVIFCVIVLLPVVLGFLLWTIWGLPYKEIFELEKKACLPLPISASGPHQDAPDAIVRFPREKREEGQSGRSEQDGIPAIKEMPAYYEQLNAFIRPKWNAVAPTSVDLNISTWPVVNLTIAKDGRISKTTIVSKSGNKAIDAAVDTLLADLKVAPIPPLAVEIPVVFEVR